MTGHGDAPPAGPRPPGPVPEARQVGLACCGTGTQIADEHAKALRAEFGEPVNLVGMSTGGSIAQQLAVDHPTWCAGW